MPAEAVVILIEEARANRERATRAREVARFISAQDVCDSLIDYADRLEQRALALEERAAALERTVAKNHELSGEVRKLVDDAHRTLGEIRSVLNATRKADPA